MSEQYLKYVGKDKGTLPGVPARDLSYEECKANNYDVTKLLQSGLYEYTGDYAMIEEVKKKPAKKSTRSK